MVYNQVMFPALGRHPDKTWGALATPDWQWSFRQEFYIVQKGKLTGAWSLLMIK